MLVHTTQGVGEAKRLPWYANVKIFVVLSILMLGWIQRIYLIKKSVRIEFILSKLVLK